MNQLKIMQGDCLAEMEWIADETVQTCVTSPPYFGLRDYGHDGQIGLEQTPEEYVRKMVEVFREVRRILKPDGTLWLNLGDSYAGSGLSYAEKKPIAPPGYKKKDLIGIPWMVAFALRADGWYLRQDIVWHKPNPMPESVTDRCTKAHEYIFLMSKSPRYFFDSEAMKEPALTNDTRRPYGSPGANMLDKRGAQGKGQQREEADGATRNRRSVWNVATRPYKGAHFATYPPALIEPCILAGSRPGDVVFDPFGGSGTTAAVALNHGRRAWLCELNPEYVELIKQRTQLALRDDEL